MDSRWRAIELLQSWFCRGCGESDWPRGCRRALSCAASDHNHEHVSLYVEADGTWRVIAPMGPGPQPFGTSGDMELWTSADEGATWRKIKTLTPGSRYNHRYVRKSVNAHPDFYSLWADGSPLEPTPSSLCFATKDGAVFRLPEHMTGATAKPERVP